MTLWSTTSRFEGRVSRSVRAAFVLMCTLILSTWSFHRSAVADQAGLKEVGRLAFPAGNTFRGGLVLDTANRIGFRLYGNSDEGLTISSFDLDTLKDLKTASFFDFPANPNFFTVYGYLTAVGGGRLYAVDEAGWIHAFDERTLERVALFPSPLPLPGGNLFGATFAQENRYGHLRQTPEGQRTPVAGFLAYGGLKYLALTYLEPGPGNADGKLLLLTHGFLNDPAEVFAGIATIHRWDAETGREDWVKRVGACSTGRGFGNLTRFSTGLSVANAPGGNREIIFGCIGRGPTGEAWRVSISNEGTLGTETQVGLVASATDFLIDPLGRRAIALTLNGFGQDVISVDVDRKGILGGVGISYGTGSTDYFGAGLDPATGRIYTLSQFTRQPNTGKTNAGGIAIIDARRQPLPQGFAYTSEAAVPVDMIYVDPASGSRPTRIFARRGVRQASSAIDPEPFFRVYSDTVPVQKDPPISAADTFTVNVPEREGITSAAFTAGATGYGLRAILLGGTNALPDYITYVRGESITKDMLVRFGAAPACGDTNREFVFATINPGTSLSDTGGSADAAPAGADPRTIQEIAEPVGSCSPVIAPATTFGRPVHPDDALGPGKFKETGIDETVGPPFPFSSAVCLPPDRPTDDSPHQGDVIAPGTPYVPGYKAHVECTADGSKVIARAVSASNDAGLVSFEGASTNTTIKRIAGGGVKVVTTSEVTGLNVKEVGKIGKVTAQGISKAAGRKGSSSATFTSKICGLDFPGLKVDACFDPRAENMKPLIDSINVLLAQRQLQIRLPQADRDLLDGTPGGALSAVQKDRFGSLGERLFNNDFSTAIPAFELLRLHDSTQGRGRQIYQVAGVEASNSYNISLIPAGLGGADDSETDFTDEIPLDAEELPDGEFLSEDLGPPSLAQVFRNIIQAIKYMFRNPREALSVISLIFVAFALPLHLLERRRLLTSEVLGG